mmetsp:Transcript_7837/g.15843  ORF Transcript_7837/g.15843 Transcript_7837/m.15843 type:complete len:215 (+) Transcript_7837:96-740(+)
MVADALMPSDTKTCFPDENLKNSFSVPSAESSELVSFSMEQGNANHHDVPYLETSDVESQISAVAADCHDENTSVDVRNDSSGCCCDGSQHEEVTPCSRDGNDKSKMATSVHVESTPSPEHELPATSDHSAISSPSQQQNHRGDVQSNRATAEAEATVPVIDRSYTVTWSSIARGEKWCGIVMPRYTWLFVLVLLIAILCTSVGYVLYSLGFAG